MSRRTYSVGRKFKLNFGGLAFGFLLLGVASSHATIGVAFQMLLGNPSNATAEPDLENLWRDFGEN